MSYDHRNYEKKPITMRKKFEISDEHRVFAYSDVFFIRLELLFKNGIQILLLLFKEKLILSLGWGIRWVKYVGHILGTSLCKGRSLP